MKIMKKNRNSISWTYGRNQKYLIKHTQISTIYRTLHANLIDVYNEVFLCCFIFSSSSFWNENKFAHFGCAIVYGEKKTQPERHHLTCLNYMLFNLIYWSGNSLFHFIWYKIDKVKLKQMREEERFKRKMEKKGFLLLLQIIIMISVNKMSCMFMCLSQIKRINL